MLLFEIFVFAFLYYRSIMREFTENNNNLTTTPTSSQKHLPPDDHITVEYYKFKTIKEEITKFQQVAYF